MLRPVFWGSLLFGLLLLSPPLWAEVAVDPNEYKALLSIQDHIPDGSLFKELKRIDDLDRRRRGSYAVNEEGHVVSLNLGRITYEDLSFLCAFPYLRFLDIRIAKKLTSMRGIESNTRLEKIWLMEVPVTRIEGLDNLERLTVLSIHEGRLTSMEGVKNLSALEYLILSDNKLTKFEGLDELNNLKRLSVQRNPVERMVGLGEKPSLEKLTIYGTRIRQLEDYDSLSNMQIAVDEDFSFDDNAAAIKALEARGVEIYKI